MQNDKARGLDEIPTEALIRLDKINPVILTQLINAY